MYYPKQTPIVPLVTIMRDRMLPIRGEVLVQYGRTVAASDTVAKAGRFSERVIVDVAEEMKVSPEEAMARMVVHAGNEVEAGGELAVKKGLFGGKTVRSPMDAIVAAVEGGRVVLDGAPEVIELKAAMPGSVTEVIEGFGVQIRMVGALVQGVWGTGGVNAGTLQVIGAEFGEGDELPGSLISLNQRGSILLTHVPIGAEVLDAASEHRVRGLIAPSMHASLIETARAMDNVSLVLTEGFGRRTMMRRIHRLLSTHATREVVLIANEPQRWEHDRAEVIVPVDTPAELPASLQPGQPVRVGSEVRVVCAPYAGKLGTVVDLPDRTHAIANGIKARGAWLELEHSQLDKPEVVFVPLANIELVG
ncbi:MAG: hypothetical protein JXB47_21505 [Anaerolineae bacterium]|nr:hypothetical protein [Anaerolineae bacterium]